MVLRMTGFNAKVVLEKYALLTKILAKTSRNIKVLFGNLDSGHIFAWTPDLKPVILSSITMNLNRTKLLKGAVKIKEFQNQHFRAR